MRFEPAVWEQLKHDAQTALPPRDFIGALRKTDCVALIAEVKHASPSKGVLIEPFDPVGLGMTFAQNGAAAISVLTDEPFFMGHLNHLLEVRDAVTVPVLRKDFIIDEYQVYEGRAHGADAMLLIVAALEDGQLAELHRLIQELGMAALVEVHHEAELERALKMGAALIGVNNRDLKTFHEDLETTARLAKLVPPEVTLVAESAIRSTDDARRMGELGAHAVLVGEGLVKADNIALKVREFSSQTRGRQ
ncbi:MAG: indole-3-glycerol phosphate synthase TrpC [Acidobacteriales bacterium]|nr:indole-3-glycerol phosphate synthase TrpC [Terriglobales bacterium]